MKKGYLFFSSFVIIICLILLPNKAFSQDIDSTQIGKKYPYFFPFLGKKAYEKGYVLQKPHGFMMSTLFNKQGIILENMDLAFAGDGEEPNFETLEPIADLIEFGPSEGRINTLNFRFDTWVLPFINVGGYYGKVWGEQTVTLTAPIELSSTTDIRGQYYGLNIMGVIPIKPFVLNADYGWSWTTNERLDKPVLVKVSGLRLIYRLPSKRPDRFVAIWGGTQFQNLTSRTSGNIGLDEALNLDGEALDALDARIDNSNANISDLETAWIDYTMSPEWDQLGRIEQAKQQATYDLVHSAATTIVSAGESASSFLRDLSTSDVYYRFDKRLEYEWNMLLGVNWQLNQTWQIRTEYGFLKSKQQLMFMASYRFGL